MLPPKKRRSPSSSSSKSLSPLQKRLFSKRTAIFPNSSATVTTALLPLQRSLLEPIKYDYLAVSSASTHKLLKENPKNVNITTTTDTFMENKPSSSLRRTSSAPIPSDYQILATPAPPPSSDNQETPNSKRLKRMQEKMQQMTEWCYQVMNEEQEEAVASEDDCNRDEGTENGTEEAVWVDENLGGTMIHFNCPCGKRYEVLHSGSHFYYKLV